MDKDNTRPFITDRTPKKSLGEILVEENLITPDQLESALALQRQQGGKLSEILTWLPCRGNLIAPLRLLSTL